MARNGCSVMSAIWSLPGANRTWPGQPNSVEIDPYRKWVWVNGSSDRVQLSSVGACDPTEAGLGGRYLMLHSALKTELVTMLEFHNLDNAALARSA